MVIPRVLVWLSSLAPRGPLSSQAMHRRVFVCMGLCFWSWYYCGCYSWFLACRSAPSQYQCQGGLSPFRRLFVTVGWTSTPIAKFSLRPGVARAQNRAILLMSLSGFLGLSPLITFILISFTFLLLIILRTPHLVFFPWRILSFPLLPGFRCKLNLVADLATPRIWWLCLLICSVLWMVPPFLSFPHIPFLALLGSICLPSVLVIMVAFFQTPMFSPHYSYPTGFSLCQNSLFCLHYCYSWCPAS